MTPFVPGSEDWRAYVERLDQYFVANGVEDAAKKRAILLSVCGVKTYQLMRDLVSPAKPADKTYGEIVDVVTKHYSPKPSAIMQRFKFNSRARAKEESIPAYVAALRQLSEFCEYGDTLQHMLRDRLVCGVNDEKMQRRLLSEPNLTYEKGLQLALAMETAERDTHQLSSTRETPVMYHSHNNSAGRARESRSRNPSSPSTRACHRCGATDHLAPECRFIKAECRSCKKIGHLERVCRYYSRPIQVSRYLYWAEFSRMSRWAPRSCSFP